MHGKGREGRCGNQMDRRNKMSLNCAGVEIERPRTNDILDGR